MQDAANNYLEHAAGAGIIRGPPIIRILLIQINNEEDDFGAWIRIENGQAVLYITPSRADNINSGLLAHEFLELNGLTHDAAQNIAPIPQLAAMSDWADTDTVIGVIQNLIREAKIGLRSPVIHQTDVALCLGVVPTLLSRAKKQDPQIKQALDFLPNESDLLILKAVYELYIEGNIRIGNTMLAKQTGLSITGIQKRRKANPQIETAASSPETIIQLVAQEPYLLIYFENIQYKGRHTGQVVEGFATWAWERRVSAPEGNGKKQNYTDDENNYRNWLGSQLSELLAAPNQGYAGLIAGNLVLSATGRLELMEGVGLLPAEARRAVEVLAVFDVAPLAENIDADLSALREDKRMACVDPAFRPTGNGPKKVKT